MFGWVYAHDKKGYLEFVLSNNSRVLVSVTAIERMDLNEESDPAHCIVFFKGYEVLSLRSQMTNHSFPILKNDRKVSGWYSIESMSGNIIPGWPKTATE